MAAFTFRYGPDAQALHVRGDGSVECAGRTPFHGIISRGLLGLMRDSPELATAWARFGHRLALEADTDSPALLALQAAARECGVLTLGQSAACARDYVGRYCRGWPAGGPVAIELWHIKEGHTSSVWRVFARSSSRSEEFVVNVARDHAAGEELRATSRIMQRIARAWSGVNMARVFEIATVGAGSAGLTQPVPVTRNEWIADSHELHRLPTDDLVLVERFVAARPEEPWRINAIVGRRLTQAESSQVDDDVRRFMERASHFSAYVDMAEGDVVWNGERAIVVAVGQAEGEGLGAADQAGGRGAVTCPSIR